MLRYVFFCLLPILFVIVLLGSSLIFARDALGSTNAQERLERGDIVVSLKEIGNTKFVVGRVLINEPREKVWPIVANPFEFPGKIFPRMKRIEVITDQVILWDGCGLSRKDFVTPYSLNIVLKHMAEVPSLSGYLQLLNTATIKPAGKYQLKTGAMDSVRTITGLMYTHQGKKLAVTVMVNGHGPSVKDLRTSLGILINQLAIAGSDHP